MFDTLGYISITTASLAVLLNCGLLPIIAFRSSKHIGNYKILLFLNTVVDAYYSLVHAVTVPGFYVEHGSFMFYSTNTYVSPKITTLVIFGYTFGYVMIVELLCVCFLYRLSIMQNRTAFINGSSHSKKTKLIIAAVCAFFAIYITVSVIYALHPTDEFTNSIRSSLHNRTGVDVTKVGYIGAYIYNPNTNGVVIKVANVIAGFATFVAAGVLLMFYCTVRILKEFRESIKMTTVTTCSDKYQRRLFFLLLLQALFPLIFTLAPPLMCFFFSLARISPGDFPNHLGVGMAFASALEPCLVVYFIGDYRKAVVHLVTGIPPAVTSSVHRGHTVSPATLAARH